MNQRLSITLLLTPFVLAAVLLYVFERTDPVSIGPGGILGVFILIYLITLSSLFIVLHFGVAFVSRIILKKRELVHKRQIKIGVRKAYYIASLFAFVPVLLLAMGSYSQLRFSDMLLIVAFIALVTFYIIKRG
jgi:Ca2+/Na+ antiporter